MEERIFKEIGGIQVAYHHSQRVNIERPGDDPAKGRTYGDLNPRIEVLRQGEMSWRGDWAVPFDFQIQYDIAIPMRDSLCIRANLFQKLPAEQPCPAVVTLTPFGKDAHAPVLPEEDTSIGANIARGMTGGSPWRVNHSLDPLIWMESGYAIVVADIRGGSNSQGDASYFGQGQDSDDYYDLVEWVAAQSWCTGRVGTIGASWLGINQWYMAAKHPPHLACIAPCEGHGNMYRDEYIRMGIPDIGFARDYFTPGSTYQEDVREMIRTHPYYDAYWETKRAPFEKITVPMYLL